MTTPPSTSLVDDLMSQLQGAPLQQIAHQLGTGTEQAGSAVQAALPLLLGALGRNAASPQGAQALWSALERDHAPAPQAAAGGLDLGGLLGAMLGGGAGAGASGGGLGGLVGSLAGGRALDGGAILGHIFGGGAGRERAEAGLGQATGLGSQAGQLLQLLAPIVMAFLAQRTQASGMDAGGLGAALGQAQTQARQQHGDLLGSLLDQDGDGQVGLGDLIKIGGGLLGGRR